MKFSNCPQPDICFSNGRCMFPRAKKARHVNDIMGSMVDQLELIYTAPKSNPQKGPQPCIG